MNAPNETIEVGMGATVQIGSDSWAATVIEVNRSRRVIKVQTDRKRGRGIYVPDPHGTIYTVTLRQNGQYRVQGWKRGQTGLVNFGKRRTELDPSF